MPIFVYKAKHGPDDSLEGELYAESGSEAGTRLEAMGLTPVWIREKKGEKAAGAGGWFGRHLSSRDVTLFTWQLASLLKSGVPILRALSTIGDQAERESVKRAMGHMSRVVREGQMLSSALESFPSAFSALYRSMVRAGESAGVLDTMLFRLAESREKEEDLRRKIQAATAYPVLIVLVGLGTVFVLLSFFLPRVIDLFRNYQDLPLPTRILIGTSRLFSDNWYWILLVVVLVGTVLWRLAAAERGKSLLDRIRLHLPWLGRFLQEAEMARFSRTLALLLKAGIRIDRAMELSAGAMSNQVLRTEVDKVRENTVKRGMPLSAGTKQSSYFPAMVSTMMAVGEESGRLDESLGEIASFYEKTLDQRVRLATSLLEPILILLVGAVVGFIVAAMLLPIFEISMAM